MSVHIVKNFGSVLLAVLVYWEEKKKKKLLGSSINLIFFLSYYKDALFLTKTNSLVQFTEKGCVFFIVSNNLWSNSHALTLNLLRRKKILLLLVEELSFSFS